MSQCQPGELNRPYRFQLCASLFLKLDAHVHKLRSLVAFCVMFCVPSYLWPAIRRKEIFSNQTNSTHLIYHISASDLEIASNHTVYNLMFYSQVIWIHTHFIYFLIKFHTSLFLGHICQIYTMFFASHVYFTVDLIIVIYINFFKYFF